MRLKNYLVLLALDCCGSGYRTIPVLNIGVCRILDHLVTDISHRIFQYDPVLAQAILIACIPVRSRRLPGIVSPFRLNSLCLLCFRQNNVLPGAFYRFRRFFSFFCAAISCPAPVAA